MKSVKDKIRPRIKLDKTLKITGITLTEISAPIIFAHGKYKEYVHKEIKQLDKIS